MSVVFNAYLDISNLIFIFVLHQHFGWDIYCYRCRVVSKIIDVLDVLCFCVRVCVWESFFYFVPTIHSTSRKKHMFHREKNICCALMIIIVIDHLKRIILPNIFSYSTQNRAYKNILLGCSVIKNYNFSFFLLPYMWLDHYLHNSRFQFWEK